MTLWLMVNIINAVISLNKHEETSTISINYVRDVRFPAVTLCNYNQFRNGSMSDGAIETLGMVFGVSSSRLINADVDLTPLEDEFRNLSDSQTIERLKLASHRIEDMITECSWRSKPCSHLNFTQRVLDHGVCYTFNDPVDEKDVLTVRNPGSRNGLYLRLNIQHDLYTFGKTTAAGIKVSLHPQSELPIVKELAFSLSPGFETSVAVRQRVVCHTLTSLSRFSSKNKKIAFKYWLLRMLWVYDSRGVPKWNRGKIDSSGDHQGCRSLNQKQSIFVLQYPIRYIDVDIKYVVAVGILHWLLWIKCIGCYRYSPLERRITQLRHFLPSTHCSLMTPV